MQKQNSETLEAFHDIVNILIDNSLLLSLEEKSEFTMLTPLLDQAELMELFRLLVGAKASTEDILQNLAKDYPAALKDMDKFQIDTLKSVFKGERQLFKESLNQ